MPTKRTWVDTAVVNNKIYAIGGEVSPRHDVPPDDEFFARIEEYKPRTDRWRKRPDMPLLRFSFSTVAIDKKIYLIGGYTRDNGFKTLTSIDVYEPSLNRWGTIPPLPTPKIAPAVAVNGVIYMLGGFIRGQRFSQAVEAFDTEFRAVNPKRQTFNTLGKIEEIRLIPLLPAQYRHPNLFPFPFRPMRRNPPFKERLFLKPSVSNDPFQIPDRLRS